MKQYTLSARSFAASKQAVLADPDRLDGDDYEAQRSGWILIADPDPVLRRRLADALTADHHQVTEVGTQSAMLELLATSLLADVPGYALLICSATLPGWSGLNMLHALGEARAAPRIVLLRERNTDDLLAVAYRVGAAAVLDRRVDAGRLRTAVNAVLSLAP